MEERTQTLLLEKEEETVTKVEEEKIPQPEKFEQKEQKTQKTAKKHVFGAKKARK